MTPHREFFLFEKRLLLSRELKKLVTFTVFSTKKIKLLHIFFKKNLVTQKKRRQLGD